MARDSQFLPLRTKRNSRNFDGTEITSKHFRELLPLVLGKVQGLQKERTDEVLAAWSTLIGERHSAMTKAVSFVDGVLLVKVKNSTLYSLLVQHEKLRLLAKLKTLFPTVVIKTIVFRIG